MTTTKARPNLSGESGIALVYTVVVLTAMLLFTGVAIDAGRAYVVKTQLTKAADGAALSAARHLNSGDPRGEAVKIFKANFAAGSLGTLPSPDPTAAPNFFSVATDNARGVNIVTVNASTVMPTTFMNLANFRNMTVGGLGEATRRMVDLSLVLDVSSSIGYRWSAVHDASQAFINAFDQNHDRFALMTFGNGAHVIDQMPSSRGFAKSTVASHVPSSLPGGSTNMVEGLYRGWDELRTVPRGQQSNFRVIVLFTDGASNSVPGIYDAQPGTAYGLRTYDFPKNSPDPDGQTWNNPTIAGLYDTDSGASSSPGYTLTVGNWNDTTTVTGVPYLPLTSFHGHHRSSGIPTSFPLQTSSLYVNGSAQSTRRGLRSVNPSTGRYPAQVFNINNAARNLLEIIANGARNDDGDYKIRIYTIGMGELVRYNLGTMPEKPEDILKRIANDRTSPDFNNTQFEGKYYYAATEADVAPAFAALQNEIIRLTK